MSLIIEGIESQTKDIDNGVWPDSFKRCQKRIDELLSDKIKSDIETMEVVILYIIKSLFIKDK